jgi:hypothetical protein
MLPAGKRRTVADEYFVVVPLEGTCQSAWKGFPAPLQAVVAGR